MSECYDEGRLRAYIDGELPELERALVASHLSTCQRCRMAFGAIVATAQQAATLLAPPASSANAAFARFSAAQPVGASRAAYQEDLVNTSRFLSGPRRAWMVTAAVVLVLVSLLAFPPVRAAADSLLQIFRVRSVVFVPVDQARVEKLKSLNFDGKNLFVGKPTFEGDRQPKDVADAAAASSAVGFAVGQPSALPGTATASSYKVVGAQKGSFQVDVASARELLKLLDVQNVTLPDSLGQSPIVVNTQPLAVTSYSGHGYTLALTQGRSPEVTLPDGVDLAQLGSAALQALGTPADQAATMARSIDWSSTLLVPIPTDLSAVQQVTVNGAPAMIVSSSADAEGEGKMLYWQNGDHFFVLKATGISETELVAAAESVR